jgi:hypothetical protein
MFEDRNAMQRELWAPYFAALEQVVDAIANTSLDAQLEHRLMTPPNLWRDFDALFRQRHPTVKEAFEAAFAARSRALDAAQREEAKQRGIAKRRETIARKKAVREMAAATQSIRRGS